jgi:hypothetical protein
MGGQIERIFAYWTVILGSFFINYRNSAKFLGYVLFSAVQVVNKIGQNGREQ